MKIVDKDYKRYSERQLVEALTRGEELAGVEILDRFRPAIKQSLHGRFANLGLDPDDVYQDLFLLLSKNSWKAITTFQFGSTLSTYLMVILRHHLISVYCTPARNAIRQGRRELSEITLLIADSAGISLWTRLDAEMLKQHVLERLCCLARQESKVMYEIFRGKSIPEIAGNLGISESSVSKAKSNAIKNLKLLFKNKNI